MTWQFHSQVGLRELKTHVHKNLYANVHSSVIPNSQKVETTQVSINRWMSNMDISGNTKWRERNIIRTVKGIKY